mgnify:CR=1 FL=1
MGEILYDLGIWLYKHAINLAAPFNQKAKKFLGGRENLFVHLEEALQAHKKPIAWFHCASLGEFEQARPVIEAFKKEHPHFFILLTFFSPSGYEVRKNYPEAHFITYLPLDTAKNAQRFLAITQPTIAFFVKYEFWYHYLKQLRKSEIPVISFSAIFRKNQIYFKSYGAFQANILRYFSFILVQDTESKKLLNQIGIKQAAVGGDTRFDRVKAIVDARKKIEIAEQFKNGQTTLVIGSSWPPDIEMLSEFYQSFNKPLKLIIAPHEIAEHKLVKTEHAFPDKKIVRYSQAANKNLAEFDVLLIDNMGMLSSLYQYGEYAYIGGAFGTGLHNTLEAATYGVPIFFGPEYSKFKEAIDLVASNGAFSVKNSQTFEEAFLLLYKDDALREQTGKICRSYVLENTGGTQKVMKLCNDYLS